MTAATATSMELRVQLAQLRPELEEIFRRYSATNPRLFGSVARGQARPDSDIDLMVDLAPDSGNELLRLAGIAEEISSRLGRRVDVVSDQLLRNGVSETAHKDAVAL